MKAEAAISKISGRKRPVMDKPLGEIGTEVLRK